MEQIGQLSSMMPGADDLILEAASFGMSSSRSGGLGIQNLATGNMIPKATVRPSGKWYMAVAYCLVSLVRTMISPRTNFNETSTSDINTVMWAFSICYLCSSKIASEREPSQAIFGLLWAGIILTKQRCAPGWSDCKN